MLTAMLLKGETKGLAAYHCRGENYYFKQSSAVEEEIFKLTGEFPERVDPVGHVRVHGKLADPIGFTPGQEITETQLNYLLEGHNRNGEKITKTHKVKGIDLTFSAPKSVSIVGLVMDKDPAVIRAHDAAVLAVMQEIEGSYSVARPTAINQWSTGKMVYVTVRDGYSREHDPHLHTHVIVMNITQHQGKFMGLWTRKILQRDFNKCFGAMYRVHLAAKLKDLGYQINYLKNGEWRLAKVSLELEQEFSRRAEQIAEAKKAGLVGMDAWRMTRAEKAPGVDKVAIIKDWGTRLSRYVVDEAVNIKNAIAERVTWSKEAKHKLEAEQERGKLRGINNEVVRWQHALERATEKSALVSKEDLIKEYLKDYMREETWTPLTFHEAGQRLLEQQRLGYIFAVREAYTDRYTSLELIYTERTYISYAGIESSRDYSTTGSKADRYIRDLNDYNRQYGRKVLSEIQGRAVYDLITSKRMVDVVQGDAGAGKTTSLKAVAEFYRQQGLDVVGVAVLSKAAKLLGGEAGIDSMTLEAYLSKIEKKNQQEQAGQPKPAEQPKPRVIIFDETSMLDSHLAAKLLKNAHRSGDKVILVGDKNQLESIAAGRVFDRFVEYYDKQGTLITMNENYRQRNVVLREAVTLAKNKLMAESLEVLSKDGRIIEIENATARRSTIAGLYNKDTLIIVATVKARDEINEKVRKNLQAAGQLQNGREYNMLRPDNETIDQDRPLELAPGDEICFTENEYKKYDISNGEKAQVLKCGEKTLTVLTEDNRELDIDITDYRHIDYGYALTTYKAQGQTYNSVVVDADTNVPDLAKMRNQYVNITRARDDIKVFTDDYEYLKDLAEVQTHASDTLDLDVDIKEIERKREDLAFNGIEKGKPRAQIEVYNEAAVATTKDFLKDVPDDKWAAANLKKAETAMQETKQRLNALELSAESKRAIADVLNKEENTAIWRDADITTADEKIAAARIYLEPEKEKEILDTIGKDRRHLVQAQENTLHHERGHSYEMEM
jgi:conjugative relaxase-like TrwC/TraI family protein